jgi:hypothetical protein
MHLTGKIKTAVIPWYNSPRRETLLIICGIQFTVKRKLGWIFRDTLTTHREERNQC